MLKTSKKFKVVLGYISLSKNPIINKDFKDHFFDICVVNINQDFDLKNSLDFSTINLKEPDYRSALKELNNKYKFKADYLLLLEEGELLDLKEDFFDIFKLLKKNISYLIEISPINQEKYNFSEPEFVTSEVRLISLSRLGSNNDFIDRGDILYQSTFPTLDCKKLKINKTRNQDLDIIKYDSIFKNQDNLRANFYQALKHFYLDNSKSESYLLKNINSDSKDNIFFELSIYLLLKIYFLKEKYSDIDNLISNYSFDNTNYYYYSGLINFIKGKYSLSLSYFNKSWKSRSKKLFLYNEADLSWHIFKNISEIFIQLHYLKYSEKYLTISLDFFENKYNPEIYLLLAKVKFFQDKCDDSYIYLEKVLRDEKLPITIQNHAKQFLLNILGLTTFKEEVFRLLKKPFFNEVNPIMRIADSYYMSEDYQVSLLYYQFIIEKFGISKEVVYKLGYICSKLKLLDISAEYYEKYLNYDSENMDVINNLAFIYLNLEKFDRAEILYKKILEKNKFSFEAYLHLTLLYLAKEDKDNTFKYLDKVREINPVAPEVINLFKICNETFK